MFEIFPTTLKIPFMKYKWLMIAFSVAISGVGAFFLLTKGFNYGVDFTGGVEMVLKFPMDAGADAQKLRNSLEKMGIRDASVQSFETQVDRSNSEFIIHFPGAISEENVIRTRIEEALSNGKNEKRIDQFRFAGMEKAYLRFSKPTTLEQVKAAVSKVNFDLMKLQDVEVFGRETSNEYQLSFQSVGTLIQTNLAKDFNSPSHQPILVQKVDFVGAKVGQDLKLGALLSIFLTALLIFIYVFFRFDLVYAPGVVIALFHDVLITAGFFALFRMEFDLTVVAALLTLAGYSIYDTIIVYDRIREVAGNLRGKSFSSIIDLAVNQTLSRTVITAGTTFTTSLILYIFGGPVIHGFAFALTIGIAVGTYSSVFIASPVILAMNRWRHGDDPKVKKAA